MKPFLLTYLLPFCMITIALAGIFFQVELTYLFQKGDHYGLLVDKKAYNFELVNHKGQVSRLSDFQNNYVFLYFGYLRCYSICTKSFFILYRISQEIERQDVKYVIVSIDPERDSLEDMKNFMKQYGKNFFVLKPGNKNVSRIAKEYGIVSQRIEESNLSKYEMDHTNYIFLIDKKGFIRFMYLNKNDDFQQIIQDLKSLDGSN